MKPGFFKNEDLADLGPLTQVLFAGLWTLADRKGRLEDRPRRIKAEILPFYEADIEQLLSGLNASKFIQRYLVGGNKYIQIINFHKHQNPHIKETESTIPAPDLHCVSTGNSGTSPADSLLPLTDSLNPITTLSDKSDVKASSEEKNNHKAEALEVLEFLNETTGRKYRPVDATLKPIICRLKSGVTVQDCRTMIIRKWRDWHQDEKMEKYLRPATLFRAQNFEMYLAECISK